MYYKNDKKYIYQLIDMFIDGAISASTFCDEFYSSYNLEISDADLSESEIDVFGKIDRVSSRFSEYAEDHQLDSKAFSTESELREKVIYLKSKLSNQF